jgi:hypothetical protein
MKIEGKKCYAYFKGRDGLGTCDNGCQWYIKGTDCINWNILYIYSWKNNEKRKSLYGRECIILRRLPMNSAMVKFIDNGQYEIISRNALRRVK